MLYLAPLKDKQQIEKNFESRGFEYTETAGCLEALNGKEQIGLSLYYLENEKMTVLYIEPIADIPLADGILRSTLHVAAENGIMNAFYGDTLNEEFLTKIGFVKNKEEKRLDIDKLFKSSCGCCH